MLFSEHKKVHETQRSVNSIVFTQTFWRIFSLKYVWGSISLTRGLTWCKKSPSSRSSDHCAAFLLRSKLLISFVRVQMAQYDFFRSFSALSSWNEKQRHACYIKIIWFVGLVSTQIKFLDRNEFSNTYWWSKVKRPQNVLCSIFSTK